MPLVLQQAGIRDGRRASNWIRNNSMQGGVVGAPGTIPTNWQRNTPAVLVHEVVAVGQEAGLDYIDCRISGTVLTTDQAGIYFETAPGIPALPGQVWSLSAYLKLVAGSGIGTVATMQLSFDEFDSSNGYLATQSGTDQEANAPTSADLNRQRYSQALVTANASCRCIVPYMFMFFYGAGAVDFTLRIGRPQAELAARAGQPVRTTRAAVFA